MRKDLDKSLTNFFSEFSSYTDNIFKEVDKLFSAFNEEVEQETKTTHQFTVKITPESTSLTDLIESLIKVQTEVGYNAKVSEVSFNLHVPVSKQEAEKFKNLEARSLAVLSLKKKINSLFKK